VALERVEDSTKEGRGAEVGAIVCGEGMSSPCFLCFNRSLENQDQETDITGSAAICLLSEHMTVVRQRIDTNVPRKRKGGTSGHDKVGLPLHTPYVMEI
jgi:protein pelota